MDIYDPFAPDKRKKKRYRVLSTKALIFAACALTVLVLSSVAILAKNDFSLMSALGGNVEVTSATEEETDLTVDKTEKNLLFWCKNSETDALDFLWIVNIRFPECKVKVFSPAAVSGLTFNGTETSINRIYANFGSSGLKGAMEETYGITIDAYIGSNTETFKRMINYFGSVNVNLETNIEYRGDFNLILMKGENPLKGDLLYKYLVYLGSAGSQCNRERGEILLDIFDTVFTDANYARKDDIFSKIVNLLETDLTIVNYSTASNLIQIIFSNGVSEGRVALTADEFSK